MTRTRAERGLPSVRSSQHLVFAGPPGTGKTTVARLVARIYRALGVLPGDGFVEATRVDLVGEFLGHTAPKTNAVCDRALDGVLFIDEAYSLAQAGIHGGDAYGTEAIDTLLKRMEDDRDRLAVIIAGYPDDLDRLLDSNAGLASRFGQRIEFPSYSADDLLQIATLIASRQSDRWSPAALTVLELAVSDVIATGRIDRLGNARFVRNLYERAVEHRDLRLHVAGPTDGSDWTEDELCTILDDDLARAVRALLDGPADRDQITAAPDTTTSA